MSEPTLPSRFDPKAVEARWQAAWREADAFRAPSPPRTPTFTIPIPPPNVTGNLTLGHMLGYTVMDVLARSQRMRGASTLWTAGLDHAGLATQVEVRRRLAKQGIRLEEMGRSEVRERIEGWVNEFRSRIRLQTEAGGFSIDWSRFRYTMDPVAARATREAFVKLFEAGLIYRGERMVNWDSRLRTAVSDLEVVHTEEVGTLYHILYPWADGAPGGIEVATVRPETLFGDVAVAVHPDDARHAGAVGRSVRLPLTSRALPIIGDPAIDMAFGTGALKVTPRHDLVDYEIYRRHPEIGLPESILGEDGRLEGELVPPTLRGLDVERGRAATIELLTASGLLLRTEPHRHGVARSERSDAVIEPRLSKQWFVKMAPLAAPALEAVRQGRVRLRPERWTATYFRWMEGIQDWCVSRQIVWGHPIPVVRCGACGRESAYVERPERCPACGASELADEPDVLDTWFTSWLWPALNVGWPEPTSDLRHYYPASVLVTGRDIMFFWVARMIMAGLYFTGRAPFSDVCFTGMLRDEQGRKMSKHLGNSPDPLEVIGQRGADALRFALVFPNPTDEDGPFGPAVLDGGRNFLTKLWNLGRFATIHLAAGTPAPAAAPELGAAPALEDRWILSRYRATLDGVDAALAEFEIGKAATELYQFVWHDLADRYVEFIKDRLAPDADPVSQRAARSTLKFVLERAIRLLHPFVPHVTEELWHAIPHEGELLALAAWPSPTESERDPEVEERMNVVIDSIRAIRHLRAQEKVAAPTVPPAWIRPQGPDTERLLRAELPRIERLARVQPLTLLPPGADPPGNVASSVSAAAEYFLPRSATPAEEAEGLEREKAKLASLLEKTRARLADPGFAARAPANVVRETEEKARELEERLGRVEANLKSARGSGGGG